MLNWLEGTGEGSMKAKIPFNRITLNKVRDRLEIVFPYGDDFYRLEWEKVPNRFKELYVVWLKLQNKPIPDYLESYIKDTVDVSDVNIEIDLDECEKIPETYPLGVWYADYIRFGNQYSGSNRI